MSRNNKKKGYGIFYVAIAICLVVSGLAVYGLMNQIDTYEESEELYADIQSQALQTVAAATLEPQAASAAVATAATSDAPAVQQLTAAGDAAPSDSPELEGEEIEDEALMWMLQYQNSTWDTPLALASASGDVTARARATAAEQSATPSPSETPKATDKPTQTPEPSAQATETATPVPTDTPAPTDTPKPTYSPMPTFVPVKDGISMERAVTYSESRYYVEFGYLTRVNPDVVGWIIQEGTEINYPILRGTDNDFYLSHLLDGTKNKNGSLFMDSGNSAAFVDAGNYIYGHNSKNGGMFAPLSNYVEQSYYDGHSQMLLMTPFADYQIDLFAGLMTTVDDESTWRVKTFTSEASFNKYIDTLCRDSLFISPDDAKPVWGDKLLVLVTCTNLLHGDRYVIYGRMRPIVYETTESVEASKRDMDTRETQNGFKQVGTLGKKMVYAQNDPLWNSLRYESRDSNKYRNFGDGGCGPTAVAMAIANLVDKDKLPMIIGYADYSLGYTFCSCSVNRYFCNHKHAQYHLKTGDEFLRYMPLAVANFVTGNNIWNITSRTTRQGTNMRFLENLCNLYRLRLTATYELEDTLAVLREGNSMAVCSVSRGPFTQSGHYVVLAGVDDEYVYVLDPYRRDSYKGNQNASMLDIISPGVVRIKLEDADRCQLHTSYIIEKTGET